MMMKFEDVKDSRVRSLNLFEAVTNPLLPFDFISLKIGFITKDERLQRAFKAKLKVFKEENPNYNQMIMPAFKEVIEERRIEEEMFWRISR